MNKKDEFFATFAAEYTGVLYKCIGKDVFGSVQLMAEELLQAWTEERDVYICGNGGSAANAIHIANDLHYGVGTSVKGQDVRGLRVEALPANVGILTCLANDIAYESIFSQQLATKARCDDLLIVLSGSGNSKNIIKALQTGREIGMRTIAIVAYDGGECKGMADICIHVDVADMQIAEDAQLIVGHICMQWLKANKPAKTEM